MCKRVDSAPVIDWLIDRGDDFPLAVFTRARRQAARAASPEPSPPRCSPPPPAAPAATAAARSSNPPDWCAHSAAYAPPGLESSSACVPASATFPPGPSTTIWSHCAAVERRCATKMLVRPFERSARASRISRSVAASRADVASSGGCFLGFFGGGRGLGLVFWGGELRVASLFFCLLRAPPRQNKHSPNSRTRGALRKALSICFGGVVVVG